VRSSAMPQKVPDKETAGKVIPVYRLRRLRRTELPVDTVELARYLIGKVAVHDTDEGRLRTIVSALQMALRERLRQYDIGDVDASAQSPLSRKAG
jgi:hypothetical protein